MKLQIKLPTIELELPDKLFETKQAASRVASEFHTWLTRYLPTWGWRKFAKSKYPQIADEAAMSWSDDETPAQEEANLKYQIKPHSGQQLTDVLRQVAQAGYPAEAAKLAGIVNVVITQRDQNLDAAAKFLLAYMHLRHISWQQLMIKLREHMEDVSDYGYQWVGDNRNWHIKKITSPHSREGRGELAIVCNADKRGSWLGSVLFNNGSEVKLKFLKGQGNHGITKVPKAWVIYIDDKVTVDHKVRRWDDASNQTLKEIHPSKATVTDIDLNKGVFVVGRDKETKQNFRYWITDFNLIQRND